MQITERDIKHVDPQRKSILLVSGDRVGFAKARRLGFDVEEHLARKALAQGALTPDGSVRINLFAGGEAVVQ